MNFVAVALLIVSFVSVLVASPVNRRSVVKAAAKSPPPLSKYQRAMRERFANSAPADEYFGRLKLSFLGINNTFRDSAISAGDHTVDPVLVNRVAFADEALGDWAKHFPHDPQLARTYYLAIRVQKKIWLKPNQEKAWIYMNRIATLFPDSYFGKLIKKDMEIGFTEHYYAEAVPCATPTPEPTPSETPLPTPSPTPARGRGRGAPTPQPTEPPTPEPTPTPSPSPSPTPSPRVLGKGLKLQVETPACVEPATPRPTASPTLEPLSPPPAVPATPTTSGSAQPSAVPTAPAPSGSPAPALPAGSPAPAAPAASASPEVSPVPLRSSSPRP